MLEPYFHVKTGLELLLIFEHFEQNENKFTIKLTILFLFQQIKLNILNLNTMTIVERYKKPTPKFFKTLRNIGIALATAGGAIIAAPISMPAIVVTIATYMTVAGTVATAVSQAVVADDENTETDETDDGL